jgi:hypothetical protein
MEARCRAGIEPWSIELENGHDPVAFILSANISRCHLSKGQQAMIVAKALLLSNTSQKKAAEQHGINRTRIVQASVVLEYASDLVEAVLSGPMALNDAYSRGAQGGSQQIPWILRVGGSAGDQGG